MQITMQLVQLHFKNNVSLLNLPEIKKWLRHICLIDLNAFTFCYTINFIKTLNIKKITFVSLG